MPLANRFAANNATNPTGLSAGATEAKARKFARLYGQPVSQLGTCKLVLAVHALLPLCHSVS